MYLLYLDTSGTPEPQDHSDVYAVMGLAVHEKSWVGLENKVDRLKRRYDLHTYDGELHAKDFCVSISEQRAVPGFEEMGRPQRRREVLAVRREKLEKYTGRRRKQKRKHHRNTQPFVHLSRAERSRLLEDALDLIGGYNRIRLFGEAITKADASSDIVKQAFQQVVTRFDYFLDRKNRSKRNPYTNKGILVMDNEPARERSYRRMLDTFRRHSHQWGSLGHVIEAPFFVDSSTSGAVQLADIAAYALRRYVRAPTKRGTHEEANLQRIYPRFDRQKNRLHGLRHYCRRGTCTCMICRDRGHAP